MRLSISPEFPTNGGGWSLAKKSATPKSLRSIAAGLSYVSLLKSHSISRAAICGFDNPANLEYRNQIWLSLAVTGSPTIATSS
jgi:hypothetical protein